MSHQTQYGIQVTILPNYGNIINEACSLCQVIYNKNTTPNTKLSMHA
jgi:hypothetical protein